MAKRPSKREVIKDYLADEQGVGPSWLLRWLVDEEEDFSGLGIDPETGREVHRDILLKGKVVEKLLKQGADPEAAIHLDYERMPVITAAAQYGYTEAIRPLYEAGAALDHMDVMYAAENGHADAVAVLLELDPDTAFFWWEGHSPRTPLSEAEKRGHDDVAQVLDDWLERRREEWWEEHKHLYEY